MNNTLNETVTNAINDACKDEFDLFEKAFDNAPKHKFSKRHTREINRLFKNCKDPKKARVKFESKPFWSVFGVRQAVAAAMGFVVLGGLVFGGVKVVDVLSDMIKALEENAQKRCDELLKDGRYYLNGDRSTEIYFEVDSGYIALHCDSEKFIKLFADGMKTNIPDGDTEELEKTAARQTEIFMTRTDFGVFEKNGTGDTPGKYGIAFDVKSRTEGYRRDQVHFMFSKFDLVFDGDKTLSIYYVGDFELAE